MNWFTNLKIAHKLGLGFALCLSLAVAMGLQCIRALGNVQKGLETVYWDGGIPIDQLKKVADAYAVSIVDASHKARNRNATMEEARQSLRTARDTVKKEWTAYLGSKTTVEEQALIDRLKPSMAKAEEATDRLDEILAAKDEARLAQFCAADLYPAIDPVSEGISELTLLQLNVAKDEYEKGVATYAASVRSTVLFLVLAVGAGVLASVFITRALRNAIDAVRKAALGLAIGDVEQKIAVYGKDEAGETAEAMRQLIDYQKSMAAVAGEYARGDLTTIVEPKSDRDVLGSAFSTMGARLNELLARVAERADGVAATSHQLASACQEGGASSSEIAAGSERLSASATGAAATMQRLSATITEVETNSAGQLERADVAGRRLSETIGAVEEVMAAARQMGAIAAEGGVSVHRTVSAMGHVQSQVQVSVEKVTDLERSGRKIGAIVATIEGIAQQTNLLALNAAIEAARAGEHGRGFAVVAEEVRKLAEQASGATKEISGLIEGVLGTVEATVQAIRATTEQVEAGAEASSEAGKSLEQIVASVDVVARRTEGAALLAREVGETMDQVYASVQANRSATVRMGSAANQVSGSIEEVAAVSEESAAGAEEFSASLEEVSAAASELSAMSAELQELVGRFKLRDKEEPRRSRLAA